MNGNNINWTDVTFNIGNGNITTFYLRNFRINKMTLKNIYAVGLPAIIMQSVASLMIAGLNGILIKFSDAAVAVLGVYFRLQSFVFMPVFGMTQGVMPIMGYNYGAREKDRLLKTFKISFLSALTLMTIGLMIFQIFAPAFMVLFNASPEMEEIGIRALRIISVCFLPAAFGIMSSTLFQATGHGILSLIVSLLRQLILILPLAFILSKIGGLGYFWYAFPLAEFLSLISSSFFLNYLYNKEIKKM